MSIQSHRQLENTRKKLKRLEDRLTELDAEPVSNARTRELTSNSRWQAPRLRQVSHFSPGVS